MTATFKGTELPTVRTAFRMMVPTELESWYERGEWPCGHGQGYLRGPSGGWMRNVECPTCGMRLNVVDPDAGYSEDVLKIGQVLSSPDGYQPPSAVPSFTQRVINFFAFWR